MKRIFLISLSLLMVVTLCLSAVGCSRKSEIVEETTEFVDDLLASESEPTAIKLNILSDGQTTYAENYVSRTLSVTIKPYDAYNKAVTWSITWADGTTDDLDSYYQIVPHENNSSMIEVRCYAQTSKEALVTVTTVDGGYTDTCVVRFLGYPSSFYVTSDIEKIDDRYYFCETSDTTKHVFKLNYENIFGYVGAGKDCTFYIESITGVVYAGNAYEDSGGAIDRDPPKEKNLEDYKDCFHINIDTTKEELTLLYDFSQMYMVCDPGSSDDYYYYDLFHSFKDGEVYTMAIKVTNTYTHITETIEIFFGLSVTGVNIYYDEITF